MSEEQKGIGRVVVTSLISGTVAAAFVGGALKYYLDGRLEEFRAQRTHDVAALTELVGPAMMQFARSGTVARRYSETGNQFFGDAAILSDANRRMRELLLTKAHLMPAALIEPSQCLVAHYDIWLRRFEAELPEFQVKHGRPPRPDEPFDIGFASLTRGAGACGEFPEALPGLYKEELARLKARLSEAE